LVCIGFAAGCCAEAEVNHHIYRKGTGESSAANAKIVDCLAEDAVLREPVSPVKFPVKQRKEQGISFDFGLDLTGLGTKRTNCAWGFLANSVLNGTGNFNRGTGKLFCLSGNFSSESGKLVSALSRAHSMVLASRSLFRPSVRYGKRATLVSQHRHLRLGETIRALSANIGDLPYH
jgi:hypothetical protein